MCACCLLPSVPLVCVRARPVSPHPVTVHTSALKLKIFCGQPLGLLAFNRACLPYWHIRHEPFAGPTFVACELPRLLDLWRAVLRVLVTVDLRSCLIRPRCEELDRVAQLAAIGTAGRAGTPPGSSSAFFVCGIDVCA